MSSHRWVVTYPNCSKETSHREVEGIRWGDSGKTATPIKCSQCSKKIVGDFTQKQEVPVPEKKVEWDKIVNKV